MQQVGTKGFVPVHAVDPRLFPVPLLRQSHRTRAAASRLWVLHRALIVRIGGALLALLVIVGAYGARDSIGAAGASVYRLVQGEFAQAGFGIEAIRISGQTLTADADIVTLLTVGMGNSTLAFDAQKAQARLKWLRAVESATVRKVYPNEIVVEIVEKSPVVRWRRGETTWLLDEAGARIGTDVASYTDLPLVIGEGAADDAVAMVRLLERHQLVTRDLAALSRIGDRRWDLMYRNGLRIQLPERGVARALDHLEMYQRDHALLDRDVTGIDLRVPGIVTLIPGEAAAAAIAKAAGKPPKARGSSEYETSAEQKAEQQ